MTQTINFFDPDTGATLENVPVNQPTKKVNTDDTSNEVDVGVVGATSSEVEDYGKKVQSRIDKLTKRVRESERREQAAIQYEHFLQSLFDGHQEQIPLESLGTFIFNNGILNWQNHFVSSDFYTDVFFDKVTNNVILEDTSEEDKDNWVLMASIIAILSLLAILFKFYH